MQDSEAKAARSLMEAEEEDEGEEEEELDFGGEDYFCDI